MKAPTRKRHGKAGRPGGRHLVRASAEYVGGSRVKYTWPCGHWRILEMTSGPRGVSVPVAPEMVKKLARYWGKEGGGVGCPPCVTCDRKEKKTTEKTERLAHAIRSMRGSRAECVRDVDAKIARLEKRRPLSPRLPEWRAVLVELRKDRYR